MHRRATIIATTLLTRHTRNKLLRFVENAPPQPPWSVWPHQAAPYTRPAALLARPYARIAYGPASYEEPPMGSHPYELMHELALEEGLTSRYYDPEPRNHRSRWHNNAMPFLGSRSHSVGHASSSPSGATSIPLQSLLPPQLLHCRSITNRTAARPTDCLGRFSNTALLQSRGQQDAVHNSPSTSKITLSRQQVSHCLILVYFIFSHLIVF